MSNVHKSSEIYEPEITDDDSKEISKQLMALSEKPWHLVYEDGDKHEYSKEKPVDTVTRSCFLTFFEDSKTVKISSKGGSPEGGVTIQVTVKIPKALFKHPVLHAHIDLQDKTISQDVIVDLKQALGMAYGQSVQLIVNPESVSASQSTKDS